MPGNLYAGAAFRDPIRIEPALFPIARWGTPEDIAGAVSAFAGDNFLYTTGNYIDVDGGFHIKKL